MSFLQAETAALAAALGPATAYARRARGQVPDNTDPKAAAKMRHLAEVETALQGTRDFVAAVDKLLHPAPTPLMQRVTAHLSQPGMQQRLGYPAPIAHALAVITAFHLPRNPYLDELTRPPAGTEPAGAPAENDPEG